MDLATGSPLKKATVSLQALTIHDRPETSRTDEQGRFLFTGLRPGRYALPAQRQGFIARLTPGPVIAGRLLEEDGEPVAGARIPVLRQSCRGGRRHWEEVGAASTLDNGEYRVPQLVAGRYLVSCARAPQTRYMTTRPRRISRWPCP